MIQLSHDENTFFLKAPYTMKDLCKAITARQWVPSKKLWCYPKTPFIASSLLQAFGKHLEATTRECLVSWSQRLTNAHAITHNNSPVYAYKYKDPAPWQHQKISVSTALELLGLAGSNVPMGGGAYLALDMGCGKTKCAIDVIQNSPQIQKILVVCPHSVVDVWPQQIEKHSDMQFNTLTLINKPIPKRAQIAQNWYKIRSQTQQITIINYEAVWREPLASLLLNQRFDLVILDEIHRIKSHSGVASRFFAELAKTCKCKLGLSGTPLPHSPLDAFGQYRFLDAGIFGTYFGQFRNQFAIMGGFENHQVFGFKNMDEFNKKFYSIAYRVMSDDVFDLPEQNDIIREFDLGQEERRIYDEMNDEMMAEIEAGTVTASNALVKLLRLHEITNGFLDKNLIGTSKLNFLNDLLEDFDPKEPLVIVTWFTNDLQAIKKMCLARGLTFSELSGHANELAEWQDGKTNILGVQIKSGKEGVDFTRARYIIYYSKGYSLGDYLQSRKRVHRPGQIRNVFYIHLIAKKTVDVRVMKALEKREEVIESILDQLRGEET